ncbi:conserved hypothetical protein [Gammaproteobacteria bacterium]
MKKLIRTDLFSLEQYVVARPAFRERVIVHKKTRLVPIGPNATVQFEDRLTMQYQVQEMLRVERLYRPEEIQGELDTYNSLIPEGSDWRATFFIEYPDAEERRRNLERLINIEHRVWVRVAGCEVVYAIADEDVPRGTERKTSAVHFLRFDLTPLMITAVKTGAALALGIDHSHYCYALDPIPEVICASLAADLD